MHDDEIAVGAGDPGLVQLLARLGASISYAPRQRYVVVTAADRRTITFTVGDPHVLAAGITTAAPFAPYMADGDAYVSFTALMRALYVAPVADGQTTVLQPQFGALDVRGDARATFVTLHGASALSFRLATARPDQLALVFSGIASALDAARAVSSGGLVRVDVSNEGSARNPTTAVIFTQPAGATHVLLPSKSPNDLTLEFAPAGTALRGLAVPQSGSALATMAAPPPPPQPVAESGGAQAQPQQPAAQPVAASVTAVDAAATDDGGATIHVTINGGADYEWHRLRDQRWYVDIRGATLGIAPRDDATAVGPVAGLRVRQFALSPVPIVRVSLSLQSDRQVQIAPADDGLTVAVGTQDDGGGVRVGAGRIGSGAATAYAGSQPQAPVQAPAAPLLGPFPPAAMNPRLIVLDPGHGGSDAGSAHYGVVEKDVTLDVARRVKAVLVSRGWSVRMTRDGDNDVYAPNDSAHDELQARCDVANGAGARLFVSIHANASTISSVNGTTTYYFKAIDRPLAEYVHRRLIAVLGTKDDGVQKDNFYVIHHTAMPAILIETAFDSNPGDAALLRSPDFLQRVAGAIADGVADYAAATSRSSAAAGDDQ